ncbi:Queuine-tRNA ribosyltransferase [Trachipleistophora hominis]|uniref:Queuine-tRNA ribosyltransferase n=1 Tax=Trachipleistophora hominis TaxID=72359 RepID=L7JQZ8_TRAHO|nr:Queuine-tRNA ribosyltransferase [Trachipleistophora hominis]
MPFKILKKCSKTNARISTLTLNHYTASLPTFMPVATHGILKAKHGYEDEIILGNTFHLRNLNRDLHSFMGLKGGLLTDSGGFQIISLKNKVNEDGVVFLDYDCDGKRIGGKKFNRDDGGNDDDNRSNDNNEGNDDENESISNDDNNEGISNDQNEGRGIDNINENDGIDNINENDGIDNINENDGIDNINENDGIDNINENDGNTGNTSGDRNVNIENNANSKYCKNVYCLNTTCIGCSFIPSQKAKYFARTISHHYKNFLLTPEKSMAIQNTLNSDIAMQLDDVIRPCSPKNRHLLAVKRSIRWLDRCLAHTKNDAQLLFPIIQGGLFNDLRMLSVDEIVLRGVKGIAIGGLCGGEDKKMFCNIVFNTVNYIRSKIECPIYVMGVGYPEDIVVSIFLGSDMSDCVYPTRTARFGRMFTDYGDINVNSFADGNDAYRGRSSRRNDTQAYTNTRIRDGVVYNECACRTCTRFSINYLKMIRNTPNFCILMTEHNLFYLRDLIDRVKRNIRGGTLDIFVKEWMMKRFGGKVPDWVKYAYDLVKI